MISDAKQGLDSRQRLIYAGLRAAIFLLRGLGVRQCRHLGAALGAVAFRLLRHRRRVVVNNLRIVYGGTKSHAECEQIAREVFRRAGGNFGGGLRAGLLPPRRMKEVVEVSGMERIRLTLGAGRGAIVLVGHMGPWEILAQVAGMLCGGSPNGALYRPIDIPAVDAFVRGDRERRGSRMYSRKDGLAGPIALLREGGALVIFADQRVGRGGLPALFFGREVSTSRLPYVLHRKTGAPVIALSIFSLGKARWEIRIHAPLFLNGEMAGTREEFARRCNELLEESLRISIEDVFWFHERWRPEVKQFFPGGAHKEGGPPLRRALIVLPENPGVAEACASGVGAYRLKHPRVDFVLAGPVARGVAGKAGLPVDETALLETSPDAGQRAITRRFLAVDRLGLVGIDGAIVFTEGDSREIWTAALRGAGLSMVLGPFNQRLPRGLRPAFNAPRPDDEPRSYIDIFESLTGE